MKVTKNNFEEEVLKSEQTVLVDLYADWCGPCKMLAPVLAAVAEEKGDSVEVYKINIDVHPEFAIKKSVMSVPTVMFIKDGEIKSTEIGFMSKDEILDHLT